MAPDPGIFEQVRRLVAEQYRVPLWDANPETRFMADLDDSLELVETVTGCEERFGVRISDEEAVKLECVADLAALIEMKVREKP